MVLGLNLGLFIHAYNVVKLTPKSFAIWASSNARVAIQCAPDNIILEFLRVRLGHSRHPSNPVPLTRRNRCHVSLQQSLA